MLVWIRAACTLSVLPLCSSHMGRSLPDTKDSYLLIVFKAAFRRITSEDGYIEISLLKEVWCNEDMLSAVEEVLWHRSRGITSCGRKAAFQELSGLQGWVCLTLRTSSSQNLFFCELLQADAVGFVHWDSFIWAFSSFINAIKGSEITGKIKW